MVPSGEPVVVPAGPHDTLWGVKQMVHEATAAPGTEGSLSDAIADLILVLAGVPHYALPDERTISECGIQMGSSLRLRTPPGLGEAEEE
jgi:hypothetical protein